MSLRPAFLVLMATLSASLAIPAPAITMDAALQRTISNNPTIQNAKLELERASGQRLIFRSVGLPDAVIGAVGGDQGGHRSGQKSNQPFGFGFGGLTQPLFNASIPASWRRGDIEVLIAQQRLNVAVVEQLYAARVAYCGGLYNRSLKQLGQQQREHMQGITDTQKARYESGLAQRDAFIQSEMQTRDLDPRIEAADRAYQGAALQLADIMGDDLTGRTPLPMLESELSYRAVPFDVATATTAAVDGRADLQLARLLVRASHEDERIMEAAYYPVVTGALSGEYIPVSGVRRQSEGSVHRTDDIISSELRESAAYTWRVIDSGKTLGAVRQKRSAREINEILLQKMEADVPRDLSRIHNNLEAIAKNYSSLSEATAAADQSTAIVNQNLSGGITSKLEFRLAENASLEVRTALLNLAYQQSLALAELDRVTGRYLHFSNARAQNVP
jgi:outer membrane protein TolC